MEKGARERRFVLLGVTWLSVVAAGMAILIDYSLAPAAPREAPAKWPPETHIPHAAGLPTLVVVLHPKCPCSRASVGELARLVARATRPLDVEVLFVRPPGVPEGWEETDLWRAAAAIPHVHVQADPRGEEATRFSARTSGHALLYGGGGELLYSGGITAARGHAGDNFGEDAILAALAEAPSPLTKMPVFGCPLTER